MDASECVTLHHNEVVRSCEVQPAELASVADGVRPEPTPHGAPLEIDLGYSAAPGTEEPGSMWLPAATDPRALEAFVRICSCPHARAEQGPGTVLATPRAS